MPGNEFEELAARLARQIGGQRFVDAHYQRAISYPWSESFGSGGYRLRDGAVTPLDRLREDQLARAFSSTDALNRTRYALLAFGSNRGSEVLAKKLAHLPPDQRELIAVHGLLTGHAIGHSPHLAVYGSLPATLVPCADATAEVSLLMVTAEQLHALTWTEFNYLLARIDGERFQSDAVHQPPRKLFVYVSRHGHVVDPGGSPLRLIDSGQAELLDRAAQHALEPTSSGRQLVRRTVESYEWAVTEAKPRLGEMSIPLDREAWDLHPGVRSE